MRNIGVKRPLKMTMLAVTSLIIAFASAAVYNSLTMKSQITIQSQPVQFANGADTPSGSTVEATYCLLTLTCYPNSTTTYEKAVNITNTDTSSHSIRLRHVSITPNGTASVSNFTSITFYLLNASGTNKGSLSYTTSGDYWSVSPTQTTYQDISASTEWTVKVEIVTPENATASISCTIEIALDVQ